MKLTYATPFLAFALSLGVVACEEPAEEETPKEHPGKGGGPGQNEGKPQVN